MTLRRTTPDALFAIAQQQPHLYLLLDGGLQPDLEAAVSTLDHRIWHAWVYSETEYDAQRRDGPLLVQAHSDTPLLQSFISTWPGRHLGAMLISAQPFGDVLNHIRQLRHALLPEGAQALLRLHEPRTLRGLIQGMDCQEVDSLLGPVHSWHWCEWNEGKGEWYGVYHGDPDNGRPADAPLMLTAAQLHAMGAQHIEYRDTRFARRLLAADIPALKNIDEATMLTYVRRHAVVAAERGFENEEDMYGYLDVYFRYHDQLFAEHSPLAVIMSQPTVPTWRRVQNAHAFMNGAA
jgi:hypothetical protein